MGTEQIAALAAAGVTIRQSTGYDGSFVINLPGNADVKVTSNGKVQMRVWRNGEKHTMVVTPSELPIAWENPHHHEGLEETYTVVVGEIRLALEGPHVESTCLRPGDSYTVLPGQDHNVLALPGTIFLVRASGESVPNPEKGGNDWYPSPPEFAAIFKK